jgi:hypothetical protein
MDPTGVLGARRRRPTDDLSTVAGSMDLWLKLDLLSPGLGGLSAVNAAESARGLWLYHGCPVCGKQGYNRLDVYI